MPPYLKNKIFLVIGPGSLVVVIVAIVVGVIELAILVVFEPSDNNSNKLQYTNQFAFQIGNIQLC